MENRYIVYLTVNKVNGKIYVGVHKTNTPEKFDGYLGCGIWERKRGSRFPEPKTPLQRAVRKYGYGAFTRHTLAIFEDEEEAYNFEKLIVTENFIKNHKTYNATVGGKGGGVTIEMRGINAYTMDGQFYKSYSNFSEVIDLINTTDSLEVVKSNISSCIKNFSDSAYGFRWSSKKVKYLKKRKLIDTQNVLQYSLTGEFLNSWNNASDAARSLNGDSESANTIRKCASGVYSKAYNYLWSFTGLDIPDKVKNIKTQSGKVHKYSKANEYLESYNSIKEARKSLDFKTFITPISLCLKGERKSAYGFIWKANKDCDIV